jgi:hypothetical protein
MKPTNPYCIDCGILKTTKNTRTNKKGFLVSYCKKCSNKITTTWFQKNKEKKHAFDAEYRAKNREKRNAQKREHARQNREKILAYRRQFYQENRERLLDEKKEYAKKSRERLADYNKKRYDNILNARIRQNIAVRIRGVLKRQKAYKNQRTMEYVGCTVAFLYSYLESLFLPGMTWENKSEWHIDHIRPCASFDLTDPEQQKQCFHYTNLQPLWAEDNLRKSDTWDGYNPNSPAP